jgi:hypothetical protein
MRCDACTQLTQDSDFVEIVRDDGTLTEICGWCAHELGRQEVAQTPIHNEKALF